MMRLVALLLLAASLPLGAQSTVPFPPGTLQFFNVRPADALTAAGGGVWVGTPQGLVRYTESGPATVLPVPGGGAPRNLVFAPDGSVWFHTDTLIVRMSPGGVVLEQYALTEVRALTVATDGALWYSRGTLGHTMGRIGGGVPAEFSSPAQTWSLAPAPRGDVWILGNGFATTPDNLHRMKPAGAVSVLPLGQDVLFGELQLLPDGTLYIGSGVNHDLFRLPAGSSTVEHVAELPGSDYLAEPSGAVWTGGYPLLGYIGASGLPNIRVEMPRDPRSCLNVPAYRYIPAAFDSTGGLWVIVRREEGLIGTPPPCAEPAPPPLPDLIRIDRARFLAAHAVEHVPALSPFLLMGLGLALAAAAWLKLR